MTAEIIKLFHYSKHKFSKNQKQRKYQTKVKSNKLEKIVYKIIMVERLIHFTHKKLNKQMGEKYLLLCQWVTWQQARNSKYI